MSPSIANLRPYLILLFTGLLLSTSCKRQGDGTGVEVMYTSFGEEIGLQDNLSFTFSQPILETDSLIGRWSDHSYLEVSPAVEGRFQWVSASELLFSPAVSFTPATTYSLRLKDAVMKGHSKLRRLKGKREFEVRTPSLLIQDVYATWIRTAGGDIAAKVTATFNFAIDAAVIKKHLTASVNETPMPFQLQTTGSELRHTFLLSETPTGEKRTDIQLTLARVDGLNTEAMSAGGFLESRTNLVISKAEGVLQGNDAAIHIYASQQVTAESLKDHLIMEPALEYKVEATWFGFQLTSPGFQSDVSYSIRLKKGLTGELGGKLKRDFTADVSFGRVSPDISFDESTAIYLGREGARNLSIRIVNVEKVKVSVYKVFENNISHFIQRDKRWGYHYEYDEDSDYGDYYDYEYFEISDVGQLVWEKEMTTASMASNGISRLLKLDIDDKLADKDGVYVVNIQDASRYYISDAKIVSLSDLGLIARSDKSNLYVFANSIRSAESVADAQVQLVSTHNQIMATAKTNSSGVAVFDRTAFADGFEPGMVLINKGSDFNYMSLADSRISNARFEVGGKYTQGNHYDVFLYAERDIYRPGETMHMAGVVRDLQWGLVGNMPVHVILKSPNGKEVSTVRRMLDAQGMFSADFDLSATALTGTYSAELYTGKDTYLGQKSLQVEEFMPDRIKVDLTPDREEYSAGDTIRANIEAVNYFGPPAGDRNFETEMTLRQETFRPKGYEQYDFYLQNGLDYFSLVQNGKTDKEGKAVASFGIPAAYAQYGSLNARLYATVFDETGRPVHQVATVPIRTQDVFLGMGNTDRWVGLSKPVVLPVVALDASGNPVQQAAEVEVIQYQWHSVLRYAGGRYRYVSEREQITVRKETITIQGTDTRYSFSPVTSGSYEVRLSLPEAETYVVQSFYAYSYGDGGQNNLEVNREGNVDITFDKDHYRPGDKAVATLTLPFPGKVLITTERDAVMTYEYVQAKDKVLRHAFTVSGDNVPNTYLTATLIKPHKEGSLPLTVAHGFASFTVEPENGTMSLSIDAPEKTRSRTKHTIKVKAIAGAHMTIAVVDEGILALKNQKTPDPYAYFYGKRALEVSAHDLYPFLFPEVTATGGGADFASELAKRANPMKNERVKLVSFWSGVVPANGKGEVSFEIDIPGFSGSLRVMAVAAKNGRFASAEKQITVADPVVLSASIPRFLSMGDQWDMQVSVTNTTGKKISGTLSVETTGPLSAEMKTPLEMTLAANAEASALSKVTAGLDMANATVKVSFRTGKEVFYLDTDISIRPAASLVKEFSAGTIAANGKQTMELDGRFIPSSEENALFLSRSPLAQFNESLDYLTGYPFGCVEQTISKAFPQLYFEDLVMGLLNDKGTAVSPNEIKRNVQAAIDKLKAMQLSSGGISYWPNAGDASWWSSAYAAHFLLEAREKGYQVDAKMTNRLLDYLRARLRKKETTVYYYNGDQKRTIASKEMSYTLYVLALAGQPDRSTMSYYLNHPDDLSLDAKYLLACTFIMNGEMDHARKLMPSSFEGERSVPSFGGSFYSYIRDLAISANALLQADPNHPQLPEMIRMLSSEMKNQRYLNTQERSFGFLALGKYARLQPIGTATAELSRDGKVFAKFDGKDLWVRDGALQGSFVISTSGEGQLYYSLERSGIPIDGKVEEKDNHLKVRRTFYDRNKKVVTSNRFRQNDLIVVHIALNSTTGKSIENVAITDILPAGFEIENARISEMPDLGWVDAGMTYDYMDIRDDRIHFFTTATAGVQHFYYLARAVTPGTYQLGPVSADAMYNGEYYSYNGSGTVVVEDQ